MEWILQISDLETDEEPSSPPPNDKPQSRPDLPQRVVKPLGGWRQNRRSSLKLHYRRGTHQNGRQSDVNIRPWHTPTLTRDDEEEGDREE